MTNKSKTLLTGSSLAAAGLAACGVLSADEDELRRDISLMHGLSDRLVPHSMAEELVAANPKIRLESFEGADHIQCYLVDSDRYKAAYKDFLENCGVTV